MTFGRLEQPSHFQTSHVVTRLGISDDDKCYKVSEGAGKAFPWLVSSGLVAPVTNTFVGSLVQGVDVGVGGGCMKERGRFWEKFCRKFGSSSSFSLCTISVALGMTSGSIITSLYSRSLAALLCTCILVYLCTCVAS